jgi:hypothetical protein
MTTDIIGGGTRLEVRGQHSEEKQSRKKVFQNIYQGMANVVPPPCSAAYDQKYGPAGGCYGDHSHFSSLIVLFPITYKP